MNFRVNDESPKVISAFRTVPNESYAFGQVTHVNQNKLWIRFLRTCVDYTQCARFQNNIPGFPCKRVKTGGPLTRPTKDARILYSFRYDNMSRVPSTGRDKKSLMSLNIERVVLHSIYICV